ncbi:MAG: hypothetical protein M5R36_04395 [Deltaproteobacteria bacterium]|nr:hypothetical protein [Deltaproteobacteria bacterium]
MRTLYVVHVAMYDAWAAYDAKALGVHTGATLRRPEEERTDENKRAAVSYAAYAAAKDQLDDYEFDTGAFARALEYLGYTLDPSNDDPATPAGVGNLAARAVLEFRHGDLSGQEDNYRQVISDKYPSYYEAKNSPDPESGRCPGDENFDPNRWQPLRVPTGDVRDEYGFPTVNQNDEDSYEDQNFVTPHWGAVTPFALASGDQFRPAAPPQFGSDAPYTDGLGRTMTNDEAYREQVAEIVEIAETSPTAKKRFRFTGPTDPTAKRTAVTSSPSRTASPCATATPSTTTSKCFSRCRPRCSIPASRFGTPNAPTTTMRPVSAIRNLYEDETVICWAGPDRNKKEMDGSAWTPYQPLDFVSPAFPGYPSGHSGFGAAWAEIMRRFTGSDRFYDGETYLPGFDLNRDGLDDLIGQHIFGVGDIGFEHYPGYPVELIWETFSDVRRENGMSRRYGGVHFQDADLNGQAVGESVGALVFETAQSYWNGE